MSATTSATTLLSLYLSRIAPNWLQGAVGSIAAFALWPPRGSLRSHCAYFAAFFSGP